MYTHTEPTRGCIQQKKKEKRERKKRRKRGVSCGAILRVRERA
jgi:hypothetical protein